jgi:rod shape determining protein RodA
MMRISRTDGTGGESRLFFSQRGFLFPILVILLSIMLTVLGNYNLASATYNSKFIRLPANQINWSFICFMAAFATFLFFSLVNPERFTYLLIFVVIAGLVAVLFFGEEINNSYRWFATPYGSIQPSEIAKPLMVLLLAILFERIKPGALFLIIPGILTAGVAFLIFAEPDFGTSLVFLFLFFILYWFNVKNKKQLYRLIIVIACLGLILWFFGLHDYQRNRIIAFLYPEKAPDTYYHTQQSITMVGSGGIYGKGYMQGPGNIYGYIPADHTDFVLAVFAEEHGFLGLCFILSIWVCLLGSLLIAAMKRTGIARNILLGVFSVFFFQTFFNVAMVLGIAPVTGIPLPFFTYGGSSMLANGVLLGLVLYAWFKGKKAL